MIKHAILFLAAVGGLAIISSAFYMLMGMANPKGPEENGKEES